MAGQLHVGAARVNPLTLFLEMPKGRVRDRFYNDIRIAGITTELTTDIDEEKRFAAFNVFCNNFRAYTFCMRRFREFLHPSDSV
jgi:hypothetical protein